MAKNYLQLAIADIDRQIAELQQKRALLVKALGGAPGKKRIISPEGRERIAKAQRRRWKAVHKIGKLEKSVAKTAAKVAASSK